MSKGNIVEEVNISCSRDCWFYLLSWLTIVVVSFFRYRTGFCTISNLLCIRVKEDCKYNNNAHRSSITDDCRLNTFPNPQNLNEQKQMKH